MVGLIFKVNFVHFFVVVKKKSLVIYFKVFAVTEFLFQIIKMYKLYIFIDSGKGLGGFRKEWKKNRIKKYRQNKKNI